jgi:hypothetical protein
MWKFSGPALSYLGGHSSALAAEHPRTQKNLRVGRLGMRPHSTILCADNLDSDILFRESARLRTHDAQRHRYRTRVGIERRRPRFNGLGMGGSAGRGALFLSRFLFFTAHNMSDLINQSQRAPLPLFSPAHNFPSCSARRAGGLASRPPRQRASVCTRR